MKRSLFLVLIFVSVFAGRSYAATSAPEPAASAPVTAASAPAPAVSAPAPRTLKIGVVGSFGTNSWFSHPGLVITPGNNKDINYDILVGYSSVGMGEDVDANVGLLIGGTWWVGQSGPITYGPSLVYYSYGTTDFSDTVDTHGHVVSDKASDNTTTSLNFIFTAKTQLIPSIDLRADVVVYSSVSGKHYGEDLKSYNQMLNTIQVSLVYNFPM